jgi:hypothetical protein
MKRLKSHLHFLHVLKDAKTQARSALLASASDDLVKAIFDCAINTQNGNHKLTKVEKSTLKKYKDRLRALVNPKTSFKSNRKLLIKIGGFIVPLFTSILLSKIGALFNSN